MDAAFELTYPELPKGSAMKNKVNLPKNSRSAPRIKAAGAVAMALVAWSLHANVQAQQALQEWQKEEMFKNAILDARLCMRDGARSMLLTGQRDRDGIANWMQSVCGPQLLQVMEIIGRPQKEATAFVKALAYQEVNTNPELRPQQAQKPAKPKGLVPSVADLSEAEYLEQFRCPESMNSEKEQQQAMADFLQWYGAHNDEVTVEKITTYRTKILISKGCSKTLANMRRGSSVEPATPKAEVPVDTVAYLPIDTIVVNLADPGGEHVAQIGITLELRSKSEVARVNAVLPAIRSQMIELFARQTSEELLTQSGKEKLKDGILKFTSAKVGKGAVKAVMFSSFVVQ